MLRFAPKSLWRGARPIDPLEDEALRAAFGRYGGSQRARQAAAIIVAKYQGMGSGRWFLCDCVPEGEMPPALVPVDGRHIKRLESWPSHSVGCEFARTPDEQRTISDSFRHQVRTNGHRLLGAFKEAAVARPEQQVVRASRHSRRSGLGSLLADLMMASGIQSIEASGEVGSLTSQFGKIRQTAEQIYLDKNVRLSDMLCLFPNASELEALSTKITHGKLPWSSVSRPHGIVITIVNSVAQGCLNTARHGQLPIRGRVSVWGEPDGDARADEEGVRSPYLSIALMGQGSRDGDVELLSAYVHPISGPTHIMLMDSDLERKTFDQIVRVRGWLVGNGGVGFSLQKPLLDVTPRGSTTVLASSTRGEEAGSAGMENGPTVIPDFVLVTTRGQTVIVETMGYANSRYRERKSLTHPLMKKAFAQPHLAQPQLVFHDFHVPDIGQERRDNLFWRSLRSAVNG